MTYNSYPFGELVEKWIDNRGKTPPLSEDGVPLLEVKHLHENSIFPKLSGTKFVSIETFKTWFRSYLKTGDILFSTVGTAARVSMTPEDRLVAIAQNVLGIRFKSNLIDPWYMFYYMRGKQFQHDVEARLVTTVQASIKRADMTGIPVKVPSLCTQKAIVDKVYAVDKKIQLNQEINQTLEQIAQAIFKSWFVDFDPVKAKINALAAGGSEEDALLAAMQAISGKDKAQLTQLQTENPEHYDQLRTTAELFPSAMQDSELGEIPEGWEVKCIKEVAEVVKGKSYKSAELAPSDTALVTLKSFNRGGGYRLDGLKPYTGKFKTQQEVQVGDLIIAYTDVTQAADVIGKPAMVIDDDKYSRLVVSLDVAVIRPDLQSLKPFLYGLARSSSFQSKMQSHTTGTTVLHLAKSAVPEFEFALPPKDLIATYEDQVKPLFSLVNESIQESRNLERVREAVLPKLLSGEINIAEESNNQSTDEFNKES